jgi:DNA-binding HxlR family transcriptional regulator
MTETAGYDQFCPVAMAAEIVCTRWTPLILRELLASAARFNEIRKGVPSMSPALLSKRLRELEAAGLVRREAAEDGSGRAYRLTEAGEDLRPVVMQLGFWGQRWIDPDVSLKNLNPSLLMWDMRRNLDVTPLPAGRKVIQFLYSDIPSTKRTWWLIIDGGVVDLCLVDPGFPVDLFVQTSLRSMTAIWMGLTTVAVEKNAGRLELHGDRALGRSMQRWLGLSVFASEAKRTESRVGRANAA